MKTNGKASIDSWWDLGIQTHNSTLCLPISSSPCPHPSPVLWLLRQLKKSRSFSQPNSKHSRDLQSRGQRTALIFFFPSEEIIKIFSVLKGVESFSSFINDLEVNLHITLLRDVLGTQPADLPKDCLKNTLNNFTEELISFIILSSAVKPLCSIWRDNFLLSARSLLIKEKKSAAQLFYWLRFILQTQRSTTQGSDK